MNKLLKYCNEIHKHKYKGVDKELSELETEGNLSLTLSLLYMSKEYKDKMENWDLGLKNIEEWYKKRDMNPKISAPYLYR